MRNVYLCYPYQRDPDRSIKVCRQVCAEVFENGDHPVAPELYYGQFVPNEDDHRQDILHMCLQLLSICDEILVIGAHISEGMRVELEYASEHDIRIRFRDDPWDGEVQDLTAPCFTRTEAV